MSTPFDRLWAALKEAGRDPSSASGSSATARCPVPGHGKGEGDHRPSLGFGRGDDGGVWVNCHAGCPADAVLGALRITWADLSPREMTPKKEVAAYAYEDEEGNTLFEAVRLEPKGFYQRRPDGWGGWLPNLNGVRRVLYRLPRVLRAVETGREIYLVEGEKDVLAAEGAGAVATTNPGGCGKWRPEFTETLRGAHLIAVIDRDDAGQRHLKAIREPLSQVAASIRFVEAAKGKDLSDHLAAGYTLEHLVPIESGADSQDLDEPDVSDAFAELPRFPLHALPREFQALARKFAEAVDTTVDFVVTAMLATMAMALGPTWKVRAESFVGTPLLWFGLIAPSGSGKTPASRPILEPLHRLDAKLREQFIADCSAHERDVATLDKAERAARRSEKPRRASAVLTDITPEGLVAALEASPRGLLVHSDELAQLLASFESYAGAAKGRSLFLTLWNGTPIHEARKVARECEVASPFPVMLSGVQPAVLGGLQLRDGDGLFARILWSRPPCVAGGMGLRVPDESAMAWHHYVQSAIEYEGATEMRFADDAVGLFAAHLKRWRQMAIDLDNDGQVLFSSIYGKAGEYCARLTALLHGLDAVASAPPGGLGTGIVALSVVERAIEVVEYFLAHGIHAASLVLKPTTPSEQGKLSAGDWDLVQHLRGHVPPGGEVEDNASGWCDRIPGCRLARSAHSLGWAFRRLEAAPLKDPLVRKAPRGDRRGWVVSRPGETSEASVSSAPAPAPPSPSPAADVSDAFDDPAAEPEAIQRVSTLEKREDAIAAAERALERAIQDHDGAEVARLRDLADLVGEETASRVAAEIRREQADAGDAEDSEPEPNR